MVDLLPHNVKTYELLVENLKENDRVALIQATGTGKSYICAKYIETSGKSALILVPTLAIAKQWREVTDSRIETYQALIKDGFSVNEQIIIADEFHHIGSKVWGEAFQQKCIKNGRKIIGTSATNVRYLDGSRDMAEEVFNSNKIVGLSLDEAIAQGILPSFSYISCVLNTSFDEYIAKIGGLPKNKKLHYSKKLEECEKNNLSVKEIIQKHLPHDAKKILCFLPNIKNMMQNKEKLADYFDVDDSFYVDYKMGDLLIDDTIGKFEESKTRSILFSVNILNEGIHINGVDCVCFLRATESPSIYFQQLGRCLEAGKKDTPIVFDLVCNAENIKASYSDSDEIHKTIKKINHFGTSGRIIVHDYAKTVYDLFSEIDYLFEKNGFTDVENQYIKDHPNMYVAEIAKNLNRSETSVRYAAQRLGIRLAVHHKTTPPDVKEYILSQKGKKTIKELATELNMKASTINTIWYKTSPEKRKEYKNKGVIRNKSLSNQEAADKTGLSEKDIAEARIKEGIHVTNHKKVPVVAFTDDGVAAKKYISMKEAANDIGCYPADIRRAVLSGGRCHGFYWVRG